MNEENEVMENESGEGGICSDAEEASLLEARMTELIAENTALKNRLFCEKIGIPEELAEDIICAASARAADGSIGFENAAREIFERISGYSDRKISTGVRSHREGNGDDLLRRAFGLK